MTYESTTDEASGDRQTTNERSLGSLTRRRAIALGSATAGALTLSGTALADEHDDDDHGNGRGDDDDDDDDEAGNAARSYRVTVANLTGGQPFTPPAVAAHQPSVEVFSVGEPANEVVQQIAENGNLDPLVALIEDTNQIRGAAVADGPLVPEDDPGETDLPYYTTIDLAADASATHLTFISMLIATNDGFVGLDTVPLPQAVNASRTYYANGYDAGTEENTELFADMVPPAQSLIQGGEAEGGTGESDPDLAEDGVIHPHAGIQGDGDLPVEVYGWREPTALVQVERLDGSE